MVWLAFSVQDQVEKYGAYVGIAAFIGLAVLTLLYFSQAREVKRLREWAGRAPERAAEIEAQAVANADAARREREAAVAAGSANGAAKRRLLPEEIAAAAFARAAGVTVPAVAAVETIEAPAPSEPASESEPEPEPADEAAAPEPAPDAAVEAPPPETPAEPAPAAPNGHSDDAPAIPPAATPAARRGAAPAPAAPASAPPRPAPAAPAARRRPAAATPEMRSGRSVPTIVAICGVGVLVLAAAAFAATQLLGGDSGTPKPPAASQAAASPTASATATPRAATLTIATTRVAVLNSTPIPGLAASTRDQLAAEGYSKSNLSASNFSGPQRQQSVVLFRRGARRSGAIVARRLDIASVQPADAATSAQAAGKGPAPDVIVVVGGDKSR